MTFNHSLGGEERLDLFSENRDTVGLLMWRKHEYSSKKMVTTCSHPLGALCAKAEALQSETNTSLATTVGVGLLVTFLMWHDCEQAVEREESRLPTFRLIRQV
jgi:hypothetical protein